MKPGEKVARNDAPAAGTDDMALPIGKTCGDCAHIRRCEMFGFTDDRKNTHCDFAPSRFRRAKSQLPAPDADGDITIWPRSTP